MRRKTENWKKFAHANKEKNDSHTFQSNFSNRHHAMGNMKMEISYIINFGACPMGEHCKFVFVRVQKKQKYCEKGENEKRTEKLR